METIRLQVFDVLPKLTQKEKETHFGHPIMYMHILNVYAYYYTNTINNSGTIINIFSHIIPHYQSLCVYYAYRDTK